MRVLMGIAIAIVLFSGCQKGPTIVPVSGRVLIDGKPLTMGAITVYITGYRPAIADIDKDGRYSLTTKTLNDGCVIGEHPVTVGSQKPSKDETYSTYLIPEKYSNKDKSGLKIAVTEPTDHMDINLTWKDDPHGKPYDSK